MESSIPFMKKSSIITCMPYKILVISTVYKLNFTIPVSGQQNKPTTQLRMAYTIEANIYGSFK